MILQRKSINMIEKILLTYYYSAETKNIILNIFSKLIGYFHDNCGLISNNSTLSATYQASILNYARELRKYYHNFNKNFFVFCHPYFSQRHADPDSHTVRCTLSPIKNKPKFPIDRKNEQCYYSSHQQKTQVRFQTNK